MQRRRGHDNRFPPPELRQSSPRPVRLSANGILVVTLAVAMLCAAPWAGLTLHERATESARRVAGFASSSIAANAEVVRVERRGDDDDNDRRSVIHYRFRDGLDVYTGDQTVRRQDRDRYAIGDRVVVRYMPGEPSESWLDGYVPGRDPLWPAFAFPPALIVGALTLGFFARRQSQLLEYGRPARAVVTKVEKKSSDKGTHWRVHYEWTLLSGAKRQGRYNHGKKNPPAVGTPLTIVHDRDNPMRHSRYPMVLVRVTK